MPRVRIGIIILPDLRWKLATVAADVLPRWQDQLKPERTGRDQRPAGG